ncbi:MAG: TetR/AcrR family transcriptional regulator, partial [Candidatus Micrarchaeota archaeon]|nr:TetR/AcrR family transcriptional regulator [Candidatus Micrarchaeota archaeon]
KFSLRKVAKLCGSSHSAPYRHFKNKDELILAIAKEALLKFNHTLKNAIDKYPSDPRKQLCEMGCLYVQFFVENPDYLNLLFLTDSLKYVRSDELSESNLDTALNILVKCIENV